MFIIVVDFALKATHAPQIQRVFPVTLSAIQICLLT